MVINELKPQYVPVELCLSKEEKESVQTAINLISVMLEKDLVLCNKWEDDISYQFDNALDILVGLRDSFPDCEIRYYKE